MIPALALAVALASPTAFESISDGTTDDTAVAAVDRGRRAPIRKRRAAPPPPSSSSAAVTVPIDLGVGAVALFPNPGPILDDQAVHAGIAISLAAVIDQELIRRSRSQIPPGLRGAARGLREVRYRPWYLALVPELLVVSPQLFDTGIYGAVWRPVGLGVSLLDEPVRVSLNGAVDLAYLFIHSRTLGGGTAAAQSFTHFLRPGINVELAVEVPLGETFLVSSGWSSDLFVPQPLGRPPWEIFPLDDALWHLGGPFLKLHVRIPYTTNL